MQDNTQTNVQDQNPRKRRRALKLALFGVCFVAVGIYVWKTEFSALQESTDNAYVGGNQVQITPQVSGHVTSVYAVDMQSVKAGQLLLELDATDARIALQKAEAALAQSVRQVRQWKDTSGTSQSLIATKSAEVTQIGSELARRESLLERKLITGESVEQLRTKLAVAQSQRTASVWQAAADRARVDDLPLNKHPAVLEARAAFIKAGVDLQRTKIVAPISGTITQRTVHPGHQVQAGQSLMRLISPSDIWVDANFKESQLRDLRIGQPVKIMTVLYGDDVKLTGKVVGVSPGTGSVFALLPPQNAAGNWVKVVQRVPVRIALESKAAANYPLQIGLSASVSVDTSDRSGPPLAAQQVTHLSNADASGPALAEDQEAATRADAIIALHAGNQKAQKQ